MGNYITIRQACESYNITRKTIYNWRNKGLLNEKYNGRSVLLEIESIEENITHKLPIKQNQDLGNLTQEIHNLKIKIEQLETLITHFLPNKKNVFENNSSKKAEVTGKSTQASHYEKRTQAAIEKARTKYLEVGIADITKKELAIRAGVSRGTVQKYWEQITR